MSKHNFIEIKNDEKLIPLKRVERDPKLLHNKAQNPLKMSYIMAKANNCKVGNKKPTQQKQKKHKHKYTTTSHT